MELETDLKDITACMLDVGELLLTNGADVNRVEDTITRIGAAYGVERCDVLAINSSIVLTLTTPAGSIETQTRRIKAIDTNLNAVESANELSREICAGRTEPRGSARGRRRFAGRRSTRRRSFCSGMS